MGTHRMPSAFANSAGYSAVALPESGFAGFYRRVFDPQAPARIRLGGVFGYGENGELGESEVPQILILTKTAPPTPIPIPQNPVQ